MDKRYQVFISSTYADLQEERQEIMQALLELDCIPSGMELFPAADEDQWSLIKRVIDDCDYYILVMGGRYGSVGADGVSYTEMEYRYALETGKPIIAFLHKTPETIAVGKSESSEEGKKKLLAFRELASKKLCRFWTNPAELGSQVSRSLVPLIKTSTAIGWVGDAFERFVHDCVMRAHARSAWLEHLIATDCHRIDKSFTGEVRRRPDLPALENVPDALGKARLVSCVPQGPSRHGSPYRACSIPRAASSCESLTAVC